MNHKNGYKYLVCVLIAVFLLFPYITYYECNTHVTASTVTSSYVEQQIIVMFQSNATQSDIDTLINQFCPDSTLLEQEDSYLLLELSESDDMNEVISLFLQNDLVLAAEPNYLISTMQISEDTYTKSQWPLENTGSYRSYSNNTSKKKSSTKGVDMNIAPAWEKYNTSTTAVNEVIVAIIDTGVDVTHEDLSENIWINSGEIPGDGIDNDKNGYIDDVNGWDFYNNDETLFSSVFDSSTNTYNSDPEDNDDHGTHCAGIIGAVANNQTGIAGVASNINIKIMPLKIEGGPNGNGTISNAIKAIKYAEKMGANICNISWGSSLNSTSLEQAIKESSMLFIAAAGNTGTNNDTSPVYPASYDLDNIISVTFINANGDLTSLSNYGSSSVDIAAPGYDILSTMVGNCYGVMSGSSMAVPHVSAIAAMIYAKDKNLYASNVKKLILNHITCLATLDKKIANPGIPNAKTLVDSLNTLKQDKKKPSINCTTSYSGNSIVINVEANDTGGSGVRVIKYLYGKHSLSAFERGTVGTSVTGTEVTVAKAGTYTFYVSDYAGNQKKLVYKVTDDTTAPAMASSYSVANDYSKIMITALVTDLESGVKQVKYLKGNKTKEDFKAASAGTQVSGSSGVYEFTVTSPGIYTIYAVDNRGNKSVLTISAAIVKATGILISSTSKVLTEGSTYTLQPYIKPTNSTDHITYKSSDKSIVKVTKTGKVTAIKPGSATITMTTSSGKHTSITITVI